MSWAPFDVCIARDDVDDDVLMAADTQRQTAAALLEKVSSDLPTTERSLAHAKHHLIDLAVHLGRLKNLNSTMGDASALDQHTSTIKAALVGIDAQLSKFKVWKDCMSTCV
jgi:hypothetical protein